MNTSITIEILKNDDIDQIIFNIYTIEVIMLTLKFKYRKS